MTNEERAEEILQTKGSMTFCAKGCGYTEKVKELIAIGLAEGRKELEQWKQEWQDAQIKANEEGFARTILQIKHSELEKENAELKAQIEQLSNDNHVLKTSFITQQERIEVLEEKLQKAKNMLPTWQKEKL